MIRIAVLEMKNGSFELFMQSEKVGEFNSIGEAFEHVQTCLIEEYELKVYGELRKKGVINGHT